MSYGKMPPQAYTKETLQEAFEWWSEQSEDLRSQIQDKDDLVGYFLRINRGEDLPKQEGFTKSAKESFSTELRGLAKNLDAFEGYEGKNAHKPEAQQQPQPQPQKPRQVFEPSIQLQFPEMSKPLVPTTVEESEALTVSAGSALATTKTSAGNQFFRLDEVSQDAVAEAKKLLNLSSDEEALRALIALGGKKIKSLI